MFEAPLLIIPSGPVPTTPEVLRQKIVDILEDEDPGYTAGLPASLIEDMLGTSIAALSQMDQGRVEAVNSVTPYAVNPYLLPQQGQMLGIPRGVGFNASVPVVISGPPGYVILPGFTVGDGTNQFVIQYGATVQSGGSTPLMYAVAINPGEFAIPAGTVTVIVTSVPVDVTLTCTNPSDGTASQESEPIENYQSRILEATPANCQGTPAFLRSLIKGILGVTSRLVTILKVVGGWEVIVGSGDPYSIAGAIYAGTLDLTTIIGSLTTDRNQIVSILDGDDSYDITYVIPPQQIVTGGITWNTTLAGFSGTAQVNQLGAIAVQSYVNGVIVGQPINLDSMRTAFAIAVKDILPSEYLTTFVPTISLGGTPTPPNAGTSIIPGDPESYFSAADGAITVAKGA